MGVMTVLKVQGSYYAVFEAVLRSVEFLKNSEVATMTELVGFIVWLVATTYCT